MEETPNYYGGLDKKTRAYFRILSEDFPAWLNEYVAAPEMQRLRQVSQTCGCIYLKLYQPFYKDYNVLDHSVACALIVWHFTHDKKQALAALFHDISTPAFKHCIDFLGGDTERQELTEGPTREIIKKSKTIVRLLKRDNIRLKEVCDYHDYPIADNDSPRLAADRLEYTFMNCVLVNDYGVTLPLSKIKRYYQNLTISTNEDGADELAFIDRKIAEEFIATVHPIWHNWCDSRYRLIGQGFADLVRRSVMAGDFTVNDLYHLSEPTAVRKMLQSKDKKLAADFRKFKNAKRYHKGNKKPQGKYFVIDFPVKKRFLDPLVCTDFKISLKTDKTRTKFSRLSKVSRTTKAEIAHIKNLSVPRYAWLDFDMEKP